MGGDAQPVRRGGRLQGYRPGRACIVTGCNLVAQCQHWGPGCMHLGGSEAPG